MKCQFPKPKMVAGWKVYKTEPFQSKSCILLLPSSVLKKPHSFKLTIYVMYMYIVKVNNRNLQYHLLIIFIHNVGIYESCRVKRLKHVTN